MELIGHDVVKHSGGKHREDGKYKYLGGVLGSDGVMYLVPGDADRVMKVVPQQVVLAKGPTSDGMLGQTLRRDPHEERERVKFEVQRWQDDRRLEYYLKSREFNVYSKMYANAVALWRKGVTAVDYAGSVLASKEEASARVGDFTGQKESSGSKLLQYLTA